MDRNTMYYWHEVPGHNFRLTNFQAAMGLAQLEKKDIIVSARKRVFNTYGNTLQNADGFTMQKFDKNVEPVVWTVGVKLDQNAFPQGRDKVIVQLKEKKIETRPGFYSASFLDIYECPSLPTCEDISKNVISLPFYPTLTDEEINFICKELLKLKK